MPVRIPAVAGQFYPDSPDACQAELAECFAAADVAEKSAPDKASITNGRPKTMDRLIGGIVPHAGWACSGSIAAEVIRTLLSNETPETCVIFGAIHRISGPEAAVFGRGSWRTPLGDMLIDEELASVVVQKSSMLVAGTEPHRLEHSIEVQLPFVQHFAPSAKLLPILVPPGNASHEVGRVVARVVQALERKVIFLGSTDLTHYGPRYRFTPQGTGLPALAWAKDVNDRRMLDLILSYKADRVVAEAAQYQNACGSGAVAATMAACHEMGGNDARLLRHTTSYEVLCDRYGKMDDAVGYAGVIFGESSPKTRA